jgi:hypothetical protein
MRRAVKRPRNDFQLRYGIYARHHGMTSEQMRAHDKKCYPYALLTPYLLWTSRMWADWGELNPGRKIYSTQAKADFDRWLEQLVPESDVLTCECHRQFFRQLPGQ